MVVNMEKRIFYSFEIDGEFENFVIADYEKGSISSTKGSNFEYLANGTKVLIEERKCN
jgi:hypothetical protein